MVVVEGRTGCVRMRIEIALKQRIVGLVGRMRRIGWGLRYIGMKR